MTRKFRNYIARNLCSGLFGRGLGIINNLVLESALISASALSLLEGKAHIAGGSSFVLSASTHSLIAGSLLLLATFLAASGLVLKSLLSIELLLASTEHPVSTAILKQKLSNTIFLKWIPSKHKQAHLAVQSSVSEITGGDCSFNFIFLGHFDCVSISTYIVND
jgi:hypothetical protein